MTEEDFLEETRQFLEISRARLCVGDYDRTNVDGTIAIVDGFTDNGDGFPGWGFHDLGRYEWSKDFINNSCEVAATFEVAQILYEADICGKSMEVRDIKRSKVFADFCDDQLSGRMMAFAYTWLGEYQFWFVSIVFEDETDEMNFRLRFGVTA